MWGPTRADGGVIVHKAFCSEGRDGHLVVIKKGVDFFVGGPGGITARETKEVEREFDLQQKFIPELQGAVPVDSGELRNEVLLECCDGALGSVDPMVVGGDKVNVHVILANVHRDGLGAFVIHYIQCGVIVVGGESGKDVGEGIDHGAIILGGHGAHKDGVEVVNICNKNVLHRSEGADGEGTRKIGIHCTGGEISEGSEAEDVVGGAYFFGGNQFIHLAARIEDGRLEGAGGAGALSVAMHVTFVGGGGKREMGVDKAQREAGDSRQFLAALERPQ